MSAFRILVTGHVQGVFFRAETKKKADELGVRGWVRNVEDGFVEIHAEGDSDALERLAAWCAKGPRSARVDRVGREEAQETGDIGFAIAG